jgi:hypothetical protein
MEHNETGFQINLHYGDRYWQKSSFNCSWSDPKSCYGNVQNGPWKVEYNHEYGAGEWVLDMRYYHENVRDIVLKDKFDLKAGKT